MNFGEFLALHVDYAIKLDLATRKSDKGGFAIDEKEHAAVGAKEDILSDLSEDILNSEYWKIRSVLDGVMRITIDL